MLLTTLVFAAASFAQSADIEVKVQHRTHDRSDEPNRANNVHAVTRGISFTVKNTGRETTAEGKVAWAILVVRPQMGKHLLSAGTESLPALEFGKSASFEVGSVAMQEAGANRQDMEFQVIVRRGREEVARVESTASFDEMAASSRGAKSKRNQKN